MPVISISHHGGNVRASVRRPAAEIMRAPSGCGYPKRCSHNSEFSVKPLAVGSSFRHRFHACDIPEHAPTRTCGACDHVRVIVRPQEPHDYEAAKAVYAEAFKRQDHGDRVPPEVGIFVALWEAKDVIDELSFTALAQ